MSTTQTALFDTAPMVTSTAEEWREQVLDAVSALVDTGEGFTTDDVRARVRVEAPSDLAWTGIWAWAEVRPRVEFTGAYRPSTRRVARRHALMVWRGVPAQTVARRRAEVAA